MSKGLLAQMGIRGDVPSLADFDVLSMRSSVRVPDNANILWNSPGHFNRDVRLSEDGEISIAPGWPYEVNLDFRTREPAALALIVDGRPFDTLRGTGRLGEDFFVPQGSRSLAVRNVSGHPLTLMPLHGNVFASIGVSPA